MMKTMSHQIKIIYQKMINLIFKIMNFNRIIKKMKIMNNIINKYLMMHNNLINKLNNKMVHKYYNKIMKFNKQL